MHDRLKVILAEPGVEIERGDYSRISRLLDQRGLLDHDGEYVLKVCSAKINNDMVLDFAIEYFKEKGRMYRQLDYVLTTRVTQPLSEACYCAQQV